MAALTAAPSAPRGRNWIFHEGARHSVQPLDDREYVLHLLTGEDIIAYDLNGSLAVTADTIRLQLRNDSGRSLHNAWLLLGDSVYRLDAVSGDSGALERVFDTGSDALALRDLSWRELFAAAGGLSAAERDAAEVVFKDTLRHALTPLRGQQTNPARQALLLGFAGSPLRLSDAGGSWQHTELALVLLRLPVTLSQPDREDAGHDG
jgi:hypothetical protein